jgi:hypothetical protein
MKTNEPKTVVIFRRFKKENDIIALFPYEIENGRHCMSYQHIGQHGGADFDVCVKNSVPAKPEEYNDLQKELISIGYNLEIRRKANRRIISRKIEEFRTKYNAI